MTAINKTSYIKNELITKIFFILLALTSFDCRNTRDDNLIMVEQFVQYYLVNQNELEVDELTRFIEVPADENYKKKCEVIREMRPLLAGLLDKDQAHDILRSNEIDDSYTLSGWIDFDLSDQDENDELFYLAQNKELKFFFLVRKGKIISFFCHPNKRKNRPCRPWYMNE